MQNYPKSIRRELEVLNGLAHERYLDQALDELQQHFSRWKSKETNAFDLNEAIHQYHNGKSRELYNYFGGSRSMNDHRVANAILEGLIVESEVSVETLDALTNILASIRTNF